ncbi:MAG: TatD family hydrolase [Nibricoccus sp.]
MPLSYIDAHNHLQDEWLAPHLDEVAQQLTALGLHAAVVNGTCEGDWPRVSELSRQFRWIKPSFGLHPWHVGNRTKNWRENLQAVLAAHPDAAIGEIGLDRWILERARPDDPRLTGLRRAPLEEQIAVFTDQLQWAASENRAVTIHCLDAWGALADTLRTARLPARGFLLHAYSGAAEMVKAFAERGAYFSFNGSFLAERYARHRDTFKAVPLDRLLVETDAPAMPLPQPWRTYKLPPSSDGSTINHPGNIEAAYTGLAALIGVAKEALVETVRENFERLFGATSASTR